MKTAIIDKRAPEAARRELMRRGFFVLDAPRAKGLSEPLSSHPDMLLFHLSGTVVTSADLVEAEPAFFDDLSRLTRLDFKITADSFGEVYPSDAIYNALAVGDFVFAKCDTVSQGVKELAEKCGKRLVDVKQGYPACTVLPLGENAAVTADRGMARAMEKCGIRVTFIEDGGIALFPYEYGFIGGAAGVYRDTVYFLGDPMTHPSGEAILRATEDAGLRAVSLFGGELLDLGRIIFAE